MRLSSPKIYDFPALCSQLHGEEIEPPEKIETNPKTFVNGQVHRDRKPAKPSELRRGKKHFAPSRAEFPNLQTGLWLNLHSVYFW